MPTTRFHKTIVLIALTILCYYLNQQAKCSKLDQDLDREYKLKTEEHFKLYRELHDSSDIFHLSSAGILEKGEQNETKKDLNYDGGNNLRFDSNEYLRKSIISYAYLAGTDVTSRHIYDYPNDMKLAAGPQVNQRWCKLHLDYMLHMVDKHHKHVTQSTEMSIFNIMNSFGSPSLGVASGNPIFPGDYRACIENKLNVIKRELIQVNEQEAEEYFNQMRMQGAKSSPSLVKKILQTPFYYIAKLAGYVDRNVGGNQELIKKYNDKLQLVPTRYCWAALRWPNWPNSTYYKRNLVLRSATCLPDTCDSSSIELYHDKIKRLSELQVPEYFKGYYISQLYCLPDENSELRNPLNFTKTVLFLLFSAIWFALIVIASLVTYLTSRKGSDIPNSRKSPNTLLNYVSCWCIIKNARNFRMAGENGQQSSSKPTEAEKKQISIQRVDLSSLEGLKVISSFAIIAAHGMILSATSCWNQDITHELMSTSLLALISTVCPSSVDCFFVITGVLTSMGLTKVSRKVLSTPAFWLKFFILRYVRIVPYYLTVHWGLQSISRFVGSGPFWDYGTSKTSWSGICQEDSMWDIVIPTANFKSPSDHCNPVGWYFANDLQFSLVTPFIILLYLKKPFMGHLAVLTTCFAAMANHIKYYYDQPEGRGGLEFSRLTLNYILKDGSPGYTHPQYRCLAYFIGLATGQLLYQYEQGHIKQWPRGFVSACKIMIWSVIYILCAGPYMTLMFSLDNKPLVHLLGSIVGGTIHGITSFGVAALIVLLCTGNLPTISHILSNKQFRRFASASLATVLIHIPVIAYHTHTQRIPAEMSVYHVVTSNFLWTLESLAASTVVHLIFELPFRRFSTKFLMTLFAGEKAEPEKIELSQTSNNITQKQKCS